MVRLGTKVTISAIGRPTVQIKVSKRLSQQTASDEIIKVAPPPTLVVIIGTKVTNSVMGRPIAQAVHFF